eukprot:gene14720-21357_t
MRTPKVRLSDGSIGDSPPTGSSWVDLGGGLKKRVYEAEWLVMGGSAPHVGVRLDPTLGCVAKIVHAGEKVIDQENLEDIELIAYASKGLYAYICYAHDNPVKWNQVPPHMLRNASDSSRVRMKNTAANGSTRSYRCGKCGVAPKKGHICLGSRPSSNAAACPPSSSTQAPPHANEYENDMSDDEDDVLPPAPPALLQLRPLSEVSKRMAKAP